MIVQNLVVQRGQWPVAYLGYGRHGTCHGRHFDGGRKNCLAKL